jgi:homoaconitase/3-isopropylmalate dehydratase large subunit
VSITAQGFRTLYDMIWHDHLIDEQPDGTCLIYIDRHLVDEVDSPQAFAALRLAGLRVHAPDKTLLVVDHNVPTSDRTNPNPDPESAAQIAYLAENAKLFGLEYYDEFDKRQGICHVVGPEQGFTLPGVTLVCGRAMIVPGSGLVKEQAEAEGLHKIFIKTGFDWREPGCSMCLAMNPDKLKPGERCASTSNRNFEGRQGHKGRTHLVSPAMAAAAAIAGKFVDVRSWG